MNANAGSHNSGSHSRVLPLFVSPVAEQKIMAAYRTALQQWPVPFQTSLVPTSFGDTHVVSSGPIDAPPLVLLHAFFATALVWAPNIADLSKKYRVHAVDILGEPNPGRPIEPIRNEGEACRWFTNLLDGLRVENAPVVGNSIGGFLSTLFAMKQPRRIDRLILISPAATFHTMWPFYLHMFVPKLLALMFPWLPGHERRLSRSVDWVDAGITADPNWRELFFLQLMYGRTTTQVLPRVFTRQELVSVAAPTLLIVGDHEVIYRPDQVVEAAAGLMPRIRTVVVPGANHIAALVQPYIVNRLILDFLNEVVS